MSPQTLVQSGPHLVRGDLAAAPGRPNGHAGLSEPCPGPIGGVSVLGAKRLERLASGILGGQFVQQPLPGQRGSNPLGDRDLELADQLAHPRVE